MTGSREKRLGEILAAKGYVTEEQITRLLVRSKGTGKPIGEALVEAGHISREVLDEALEEQRRARERK